MNYDSCLDISRPVNCEELHLFADILINALYLPDAKHSDWTQIEGENNFRIARFNKQVIGGLAIQKMGQWFCGKSLPMGGVRYVGVSPAYRGSGVAFNLLLKLFEEMQNENICLSTLYPSTQSVYRRVGFERAGSWLNYSFPAHGFSKNNSTLKTRKVDIHDKNIFSSVYNQAAKNTNGRLDRSDWMWDRILYRYTGVEAFVFENDSTVEGYIIYNNKRTEDKIRGNMVVHDYVALTSNAVRQTINFFSNQQSMVDNIQWQGGPNEPLFFFTKKQEYKVDQMLHWMLRIVNVEKALLGRGYPQNINGQVHIEVFDDILPWNKGKFIITLEQGNIKVKKGGDGTIQIDIRALASLYSGFTSPSELKAIGLISGEEKELVLLEQFFSCPTPWMSEMF